MELLKPQHMSWAEFLAANADKYAQMVDNLQALCHGLAADAGWWKTRHGADVRNVDDEFLSLWVGSKLALIHTEISEGTEGHRKGRQDDKLPHFPMLGVELQDAVIRAWDLAGGLGFDSGQMFVEKLLFNAQRADHKLENRAKAGGKVF